MLFDVCSVVDESRLGVASPGVWVLAFACSLVALAHRSTWHLPAACSGVPSVPLCAGNGNVNGHTNGNGTSSRRTEPPSLPQAPLPPPAPPPVHLPPHAPSKDAPTNGNGNGCSGERCLQPALAPSCLWKLDYSVLLAGLNNIEWFAPCSMLLCLPGTAPELAWWISNLPTCSWIDCWVRCLPALQRGAATKTT